jgi:hypothetical protein
MQRVEVYGETVEKELVRMIEKRAREEPDLADLEPSYAESVRRYHARRRRKLDAERYRYHMDHAERLRRTMTALAERHESQAANLLEGNDQ